MKVIEEHHGKRLICENCQSILEYLDSDVKYSPTNYDRMDKYIECPICNHRNYILIN